MKDARFGRVAWWSAAVVLAVGLLSSLEVLRQVKGDPALKAVPVVMLTSSREERDLVESYRLGVNAYVVKPVEFSEFAEAVKEVGMFWAVVNEPPPGSPPRPE